MKLFHVSFETYEIGKTYTALNPTRYHLRSVDKGEGWINEILDLQAPDGHPSRIASFYACDQLENCHAFIRSIVPQYEKI